MEKRKIQAEIDSYQTKTPKSLEMQRKASRYLPGGSSRGTAYFDPYPHFIERGKGSYVYDVDGNKYLDFMINATSLILGHANRHISAVIKDQIDLGAAYSGPTESQINLAEILCTRIPSIDTIRFTNSGTEATMMAIRAARLYTGKEKIVKIEGGYHGSHEYVSVSVYTPQDKLNPSGPAPIPEYDGQPKNVAEGVFVVEYNDIEGMRDILDCYSHEIACVIMEPVVSSFGYLPADQEYLEFVREKTSELGIVLIFDEVQSFRLSSGGAQEFFNVVPDMTALGKIIGGGLAVGAFGGKKEIMNGFDPSNGGAEIAHAGTFNANPLTMKAGIVVMESLTDDVYLRMNALGKEIREKLNAVFSELDVSVQITGIGSFFGMHFTDKAISNYRDVVTTESATKKAFFLAMLNEGVLLNGLSGSLNVYSTGEDVDELVSAVRKVAVRLFKS